MKPSSIDGDAGWKAKELEVEGQTCCLVEEIEVREQRVEREKSRGKWRCKRWRREICLRVGRRDK